MQSDTTGFLQEFHKILEEAGKKGASDIHYVPKRQLLLRVDGRLVDMTEEWNVSFSMEELIEELLDKKQQKTFEENGEVEFSCPVFNRRVRVNLFRQSGTCAMSVRLFAEKIPTPQMLGLPESAVQMAGKRRGLILVTGASGSGRTTTMASMIDHIASNYERSILTLEKPAEYLFRSGKSMVLQREIGIDSRSYEAGLKAALKQDMDVILISEMEDLDTVSLALTAAEMGHLVIAALPTQNASAIENQEPTDASQNDTQNDAQDVTQNETDHRQHQIRSQLSDVLAGVISQQLLPRMDGGGRVAAFEVLLANQEIKSLIKEQKYFQIPSVMRSCRKEGMVSMDDVVYDLYMKSMIDSDTAVCYAQDGVGMRQKVQLF